MGGVRNGELLRLAASEEYEALISADKNMSYQQNEQTLAISVVVLHVFQLRIEHLIPLIPAAMKKLELSVAPTFIRIDAEPGGVSGT